MVFIHESRIVLVTKNSNTGFAHRFVHHCSLLVITSENVPKLYFLFSLRYASLFLLQAEEFKKMDHVPATGLCISFILRGLRLSRSLSELNTTRFLHFLSFCALIFR